ncbi:MAG TPA: hypothetical protein VGC73_01070 [Pyrinomonadaceae bacterium]
MNPTVERFFTAQAETSSGAGCGSRAIGGGVIVGQSRTRTALAFGCEYDFWSYLQRSAGSRSDHRIAVKQTIAMGTISLLFIDRLLRAL